MVVSIIASEGRYSNVVRLVSTKEFCTCSDTRNGVPSSACTVLRVHGDLDLALDQAYVNFGSCWP